MVGRDWTQYEMESAVTKGTHSSAFEDDAISKIQVEVRGKVAQGFAAMVRWDNIKKNPPSNLKFLPWAMIPHKSSKYRAILDLSFGFKLSGWCIPLVNKATKKTSPAEALEQVGTVMPRIIKALATDPLSEDSIQFSKLNIKDGFWRMVCAVGEE